MARAKKETGGMLYFDLDLTRMGVGRLTKSARTNDLAVYHKRKGILQTLQNAGKLDILKAFKDDQISIEQLHTLNEQQRLFEAMDLILFGRNLWESFADTIDSMGSSELTRRRYQTSIDKLKRVGETDPFKKRLGPGATVGDLERVDWKRLMNEWGGSAADWNHLHRMVSHFLSKLVGKKSPHRHRIVELIPRKKESARVVTFTVASLFRVRDALPEKMRPVLMTLLLTGMRRTEYLLATKAHLLPDVHGVKIPATEADSSTETVYVDEKLWHWIEAGIPAPLRYKWLRIHWKRACEEAGVPDLRFQDLRHALAQWAMEAGVPVNEVQALLRHEKLETTAIYLKTIAKKNAAKILGDVVATNEKRRAKKKKASRRRPASATRGASKRRNAASNARPARAKKKSVGRG